MRRASSARRHGVHLVVDEAAKRPGAGRHALVDRGEGGAIMRGSGRPWPGCDIDEVWGWRGARQQGFGRAGGRHDGIVVTWNDGVDALSCARCSRSSRSVSLLSCGRGGSPNVHGSLHPEPYRRVRHETGINQRTTDDDC